jgi:hypothetical protein
MIIQPRTSEGIPTATPALLGGAPAHHPPVAFHEPVARALGGRTAVARGAVVVGCALVLLIVVAPGMGTLLETIRGAATPVLVCFGGLALSVLRRIRRDARGSLRNLRGREAGEG